MFSNKDYVFFTISINDFESSASDKRIKEISSHNATCSDYTNAIGSSLSNLKKNTYILHRQADN